MTRARFRRKSVIGRWRWEVKALRAGANIIKRHGDVPTKNQQRPPGDDESAENPPGLDHCAPGRVLGRVESQPAGDLRQQLIDQDGSGKSIALDLGVLEKLHQARRIARGDDNAPQIAPSWSAEFLGMETRSWPGSTEDATAVPGTKPPATVDQPQRSASTSWLRCSRAAARPRSSG